MLKLDKQFKIYDTAPRKAAKSLIQAGFISNDDLELIIGKLHLPMVLKNHKGAETTVDWEAVIDEVFVTGLLKYHAVTLHTAPVYYEGFPRPVETGFPTMGGFPGVTATAKMDKTIYYDVDGVDYPMTLDSIYSRFNQFGNTFVAICRKGTGGKLGLTGFVYKGNANLSLFCF